MSIDWTYEQRKEFSTLFSDARKRMGMTQAQVAEATHIHPNTISQIERSPYAGMRAYDIMVLASFLGIDLYDVARVLGVEVERSDGSALLQFRQAVDRLPPDRRQWLLDVLDTVLRGMQGR